MMWWDVMRDVRDVRFVVRCDVGCELCGEM